MLIAKAREIPRSIGVAQGRVPTVYLAHDPANAAPRLEHRSGCDVSALCNMRARLRACCVVPCQLSEKCPTWSRRASEGRSAPAVDSPSRCREIWRLWMPYDRGRPPDISCLHKLGEGGPTTTVNSGVGGLAKTCAKHHGQRCQPAPRPLPTARLAARPLPAPPVVARALHAMGRCSWLGAVFHLEWGALLGSAPP